MSRPISMRVSYREDASYLLRLEAAVLKDVSQSEGWRKTGASLSRQLSLHLLKADKSKQFKEEDTTASPTGRHK